MGNPIYMQELAKDKERYEKFLHYQKLGLITEFDGEILSRLRNIYWGKFYQALLYIYFEKTDFSTIGNKVELICKALENEEFRIIHAMTKTAKDINYYQYDQQHLDHNSYVEKQSGQNTWVYDLFALLRFDKSCYEEIEQPRSNIEPTNIDDLFSAIKIIESEGLAQVKKVLEIDDNYDFGLKEIFVPLIDAMEQKLENHPYKELLEKEIGILKRKHDYDNIKKYIITERIKNGYVDHL